jgi:hypothetical protein
MITNGRGTIFGNEDNPFAIALLEELTGNQRLFRTDVAERSLFSRKDINKECDYPETENISVVDYKAMYDRNAIGKRVCEVLPSECWQVFPAIYEDEDPEVTTEFEQAFKELGDLLLGEQSWFETEVIGNPLWEYLSRADKLSGIGHYGIIIIGIDDGKKLEDPVDGFEDEWGGKGREALTFINNQETEPGNGKVGKSNKSSSDDRRKLLYLSVFDESAVTAVEYESNIHSPRYRKPKYYSVDLGSQDSADYAVAGREGRTVKVHWSRAIHVCDTMDSSEVIGVPRQRPVWNNLLDLMKVYGGDAEGWWKNCVLRIFFETHPQLGGDVTIDEDSLRERMYDMENGLQRWAALMGMSAKTVAPSVADPSNHVNIQIEAICILLGIPIRIFKGSERGELASGQDDSTWNDRVRARRHNYLIPRLVVPFINRLILMRILPEPDGKYRVDWDDPEVVKPLEKADLALKHIDAMGKYIATGADSLMDPMDFFTHELDIDDEDAQGILERAAKRQEEELAKQEEARAAAAEEQARLLQAQQQQTAPGTEDAGGEEGGAPTQQPGQGNPGEVPSKQPPPNSGGIPNPGNGSKVVPPQRGKKPRKPSRVPTVAMRGWAGHVGPTRPVEPEDGQRKRHGGHSRGKRTGNTRTSTFNGSGKGVGEDWEDVVDGPGGGNSRGSPGIRTWYRLIPSSSQFVGHSFCPTGQGGGIDPSCSPKGSEGRTAPTIIRILPRADWLRRGDPFLSPDSTEEVVDSVFSIGPATVVKTTSGKKYTMPSHERVSVLREHTDKEKKALGAVRRSDQAAAEEAARERGGEEVDNESSNGVDGIQFNGKRVGELVGPTVHAFCPTGQGGGIDPSCEGRQPSRASGTEGDDKRHSAKLSARARRAIASYNPSTAEKQQESDRYESLLAKKLGASRTKDNSPMDNILDDNPAHGIEIKVLHDAMEGRVNMRRDSRERKENWVKEQAGRTACTVLVDNRDKFQGGAHKDKYSGHKLYFADGVGAFRLSTMVKVNSFRDLKKLVRGDKRTRAKYGVV